ncbi:MAG: DNA gyrase subunit A [Actinobacteria bacterium]|nr:DNA gyrase subunit A [Actinomycetota bacterium]MSV74501.1 DNA gyrase subunit A [Actinomycetota bacterium]MSY94588.1 DNA gyrase subunit A [Actinomycetota bacterium]
MPVPDDTTTVEETGPGHHGRIEPVDLQTEMQRSYLDYSMSVIVSRALPDVRDGLKPVHRRVLYAMYDGGYRPDRNFSKSARVVGDVMGSYHPHGDTAIYDALVRLAQPWSLRYPLVQGQGNFGSPGNDPPAAQRYTECRMAPLAMEMVRDIDEDTVDFGPNYDGRTQEPRVLPARFPNLLVNGSSGIAVGMATNIPPHNLREVAEGAQWLLANPDADRETRQAALTGIVKGPDFPTGALIVGRKGIDDYFRTGRGSVTMRAVVTVDEDTRGRQILVVTELPYQVNPDNLLLRIAELVGEGKLTGIADIRDDSSSRTGMRLIIDLKRDAVAQVVLNQLYKHTQLQDNFGANMLALVDGVPRTLTLEQFIRYWIAHQIEVLQRRTRYRLRKAEERAHILRGYLKALDALDDVIALIRASATVEDARTGLMALLELDEIQATAILDMQLRRLAALERQKIIDEFDELTAKIADYNDILADEARQRSIISEELAEVTAKYGDERRSEFISWDGDVNDEDLIAVEDVVVTITSGGYAKRTKSDLYRAQRRGGRGVKGAALRQDDVVEHLFVTTTHHWILFFTNKGRVYRAKAYQLPDSGRDARGQHVANLLAFQPDEAITQVLAIDNYTAGENLVLATRKGMVKKTKLADYDTNRQGGIIAINLGDDDELISARLVSTDDELLLVSRKGMSARFSGNDDTLRPMGRATGGVIGMRFRGGDSLLSMEVVHPDTFVVTITDGGFAKRTPVSEWATKGRGILGVRAMRLTEARGSLVGAMVCEASDQIFAIASNGVVIRTKVEEIRPSGRDTMGVTLMNLTGDDTVVAVARSTETDDDEMPLEADVDAVADSAAEEASVGEEQP